MPIPQSSRVTATSIILSYIEIGFERYISICKYFYLYSYWKFKFANCQQLKAQLELCLIIVMAYKFRIIAFIISATHV
mgnify:CR=1 FL=1